MTSIAALRSLNTAPRQLTLGVSPAPLSPTARCQDAPRGNRRLRVAGPGLATIPTAGAAQSTTSTVHVDGVSCSGYKAGCVCVECCRRQEGLVAVGPGAIAAQSQPEAPAVKPASTGPPRVRDGAPHAHGCGLSATLGVLLGEMRSTPEAHWFLLPVDGSLVRADGLSYAQMVREHVQQSYNAACFTARDAALPRLACHRTMTVRSARCDQP